MTEFTKIIRVYSITKYNLKYYMTRKAVETICPVSYSIEKEKDKRHHS